MGFFVMEPARLELTTSPTPNFMVDPGRVELPTPPCRGGILPLDYGPWQHCPRKESNLYLGFRKPLFFPLNYGDLYQLILSLIASLRASNNFKK